MVWENVGQVGHTVTAYEDQIPDGAAYFASGGFDSEQAARDAYSPGNPDSGESYGHTFETAGTYEYFRILHESAGMVGTVEVQEGRDPRAGRPPPCTRPTARVFAAGATSPDDGNAPENRAPSRSERSETVPDGGWTVPPVLQPPRSGSVDARMTPPPIGVLQLAPAAVASNADLVVFLVIGVMAGAHCLGMCGPLVGVYADRISGKGGRTDVLTPFEVRQHALFNGGRVVGYAAVGALFGLLGGTLYATADTVTAAGGGVRAATGLLVGGLVMLGGLAYVLRGSGASIPLVSAAFRSISGLLTGRVDRLAGSTGIVALGAVHATLPCPIIYPAYLYAFAVGDALRGGLSLAVLGLGTFPTLFAYGTMLGTLTATQRAALHRALGVSFVALGYILVSHGLVLLGVHVPHVDIPYYQPLTEP